MALARHVAAKRDKDGCAEGVFVSTKQRGNHDVTRGAQAAIGAKTNASAETIVDQDLLRFREAEFPWVAGVLNARKRRGARAACVSCDDDVICVGLCNTRGDGSDAATGDEFDAYGSARVGALQIPDELREIFNRIDVVVRRRRDELHPRLRVAEACDQLSYLVARKLAALAWLGALRDFDFEFFGVREILGRNTEACAGYLVNLVVEQGWCTVHGSVDSGVFATLASIGTRGEHVHGFGDGLV